MKRRSSWWRAAVVALGILPELARAQISPGELSAPHAALEGLGSCTACHELGKAVANTKCLDCHRELRTRINAGTGFHGPLAGRPCVECHKEHFGRSFSLIRFDRRSFDHARVGFRLSGTHARLECERCHTAAFRTATDVRQNTALHSSRTLLGLSRECIACHKDVHRGELNGACQQCHGVDGWKPPSAFSHDRARFRLTGKHALVSCAKCHPAPAGGGPASYRRLDFARCTSCHPDPHAGKFQKPCDACHTTQGWSEGLARGFDHGTTKFPLRGAHRGVRCERCHIGEHSGRVASRRFAVRAFGRCADCHADIHRGEFAPRAGRGACEGCHTETSFSPAAFDHATAAFPLRGKHRQVPCERCHTSLAGDRGSKQPVDLRLPKHQRCTDCHADAHAGQLASRADGGDCQSCHAVNGFLPTTFTPDAHVRTRFPLDGAHAALACALCHKAGTVQAKSTRRLRWPQLPGCETCHRDPHRSQFAGRLDCTDCHTTSSWEFLSFSHERTRFPLSGRHIAVSCRSCHTATHGGGIRFAGTPARCIDCHDATTARVKP